MTTLIVNDNIHVRKIAALHNSLKTVYFIYNFSLFYSFIIINIKFTICYFLLVLL